MTQPIIDPDKDCVELTDCALCGHPVTIKGPGNQTTCKQFLCPYCDLMEDINFAKDHIGQLERWEISVNFPIQSMQIRDQLETARKQLKRLEHQLCQLKKTQ